MLVIAASRCGLWSECSSITEISINLVNAFVLWRHFHVCCDIYHVVSMFAGNSEVMVGILVKYLSLGMFFNISYWTVVICIRK